jgi:tight adherence protein C
LTAVLIGVAAAVAIRIPALSLIAGGGYLLVWWMRRRGQRTRLGRLVEEEIDQLAQILIIGLTAGLPLHASLQLAATEVGGETGEELSAVMRRARRMGLAPSLTGFAHHTGPLLSRIAHAQLSGASAVGAVAAFLDERRSKQRAEFLEAARTLPVKLMLPLGLLILPGFILIFAGPLVVGSLNDLLGGLL